MPSLRRLIMSAIFGKRKRRRYWESASFNRGVRVVFEAVDPEDRKLRLKKVADYAKRNKGAYEMAPTSNPHQETHHFIRFRHAEQILSSHKLGVSPKARRITGRAVRQARSQMRQGQKKALQGAGGDATKIMNHATDKLTSQPAWKMMRRYKGLPEAKRD